MSQFVQTPLSIPVAALNIGDSYSGLTLRFDVLAPITDQAGQPIGEAVQWTHQALLSPTSAVQLRDMLDAAIKGWEGRFGAIPALSISFVKNGEAPAQEAVRTRCSACSGSGRTKSMFDLSARDCGECEGSGQVDVTPKAVTILEAFRKPPVI